MSIDARIIDEAIARHNAGQVITDLQAKVIANAWHGGQASALYSLTSTGNLNGGDLFGEIGGSATVRINHPDFPADLNALYAYVQAYSPRGPVDGWSDLNW